ncbi:hypothetical protein IL306_012372 [Fusarium sp. DS 682]|nr:hypothetical protein IL306_012372 [Fusarium sp. DS 682]
MAAGIDVLTATASELETKLAENSINSRQLVKLYLDQIHQYNGYLKAVIATAPEGLLDKTAAKLDQERIEGHVRGPLHGIPILVKDNVATDPGLGLPTTCGSLALQGSKPRKSAGIIDQLQAAGVIILGKANLSEWACDRSALYTIKPTLKLIPQDGIIPVTTEADSAGPMAKSVLDLANLLDVLVDPSMTTRPEGGYKSAVTGSWGNIRIGVVEAEKWLFPTKIVKYNKEATDQMLRDWTAACEKLKSVAKVVKPVTLVSIEEATEGGKKDIWKAFGMTAFQPHGSFVNSCADTTFKQLLESYLESVDDCKIRTLEDLIEFNKQHAEQELPPSADNQAGLIRALNATMEPGQYRELIDFARDRCGPKGIDKVLEDNEVDIILGPGDGPLFIIAGTAG